MEILKFPFFVKLYQWGKIITCLAKEIHGYNAFSEIYLKFDSLLLEEVIKGKLPLIDQLAGSRQSDLYILSLVLEKYVLSTLPTVGAIFLYGRLRAMYC